MENRIMDMTENDKGFTLKAMIGGKETIAEFIDDGQGYHVEYDGMRFDLNQGQSIRRNGEGRKYRDDIIYIMYQPEDDYPHFVGWYCGAEWMERGSLGDRDDFFFYGVFWRIVEWLENGKTYTEKAD